MLVRLYSIICYGFLLTWCLACQTTSDTRQETTSLPSDSLLVEAFDTTQSVAGPASPPAVPKATRRPVRVVPPIVYRSSTPPPADTAAPPASEARLTDLTLKPSEYFKIDPTKPAEVRGQEGAVVRIPAGALVNRQRQPPTGPVWVELKECYSLADMLLSNLSTQTDDNQLLQASGMVLVRASERGQQLSLVPGQAIQLVLPPGRRRTEMQLFRGQPRRAQMVRWLAMGSSSTDAETVYAEAQPMPTYGAGAATLNRLVRYPAPAAARQTQGTVYVSAVIDETGQVLTPRVLRGIGDGCDEEALRAVKASSGHWQPGLRDGLAVRVKTVIPLHFPPVATAADSLPGLPGPPPSAGGYAFRATQLGWLASARPWKPATGTAPYPVATDPDGQTVLRLLCRAEAGLVIAEAQAQEAEYVFPVAPAHHAATLLGLRYFNEVPFVALQEVQTAQFAKEPLIFRETTLTGLEDYLERLKLR